VIGVGLPDVDEQPTGAASASAATDTRVKCEQKRRERGEESRAGIM
jgi:hypothetical protein